MSTAFLLEYPANRFFTPSAWPGNAVSDEAKEVTQAINAAVASVEESQALFGDKSEALSQLQRLASECSTFGWDGEDASPISSFTLRRAEAFVRALPTGVGLPEFAPETDGSISLDWIAARNRLFSVSVGLNSRLSYAWLDGTDKGHAVAFFEGERIPNRVLEGIRAVTRSK